MLDTAALEWKNKVKSIFNESKMNFKNSVNDTIGSEASVDDVTPEIDDTDDTVLDTGEGEPESDPTITLTASLLKALLDYCEAGNGSEDDETLGDDTVEEVPVTPESSVDEDALTSGSSMSMPNQVTAAGGVCESEEIPEPVENDQPESGEAGDDTLDADDTINIADDASVEGDEELTPDEIVQRLIDLSSENSGEALDIEALGVIFSPAEQDAGDDLGGSELDGNVELPATSGDETVVEDLGLPNGNDELAKKERALAHWQGALQGATPEDIVDINKNIVMLKSAIARIKTKSITDKMGAQNALPNQLKKHFRGNNEQPVEEPAPQIGKPELAPSNDVLDTSDEEEPAVV